MLFWPSHGGTMIYWQCYGRLFYVLSNSSYLCSASILTKQVTCQLTSGRTKQKRSHARYTYASSINISNAWYSSISSRSISHCKISLAACSLPSASRHALPIHKIYCNHSAAGRTEEGVGGEAGTVGYGTPEKDTDLQLQRAGWDDAKAFPSYRPIV